MITLPATQIMAAPSGPVPPRPIGGSGGGAETSLGRLKVLVVEDESVIAWALQSLLEDLGHDVVDTAFSGEGAVASAAECAPDLVIMDINLGPGISGIDAAERILLQQRATLIFVSAYNDPATTMEIGARVPGAPLLSKPIAPPALERAIANVFRRPN